MSKVSKALSTTAHNKEQIHVRSPYHQDSRGHRGAQVRGRSFRQGDSAPDGCARGWAPGGQEGRDPRATGVAHHVGPAALQAAEACAQPGIPDEHSPVLVRTGSGPPAQEEVGPRGL